MIQAYEQKLAQKKGKKPGKRGRSASNSSDPGSSRRGGAVPNGTTEQAADLCYSDDSEDDGISRSDMYDNEDMTAALVIFNYFLR